MADDCSSDINDLQRATLAAANTVQYQLCALAEESLDALHSESCVGDTAAGSHQIRFSFDIIPSAHNSCASFVSHWDATNREWSFALMKETLRDIVAVSDTMEAHAGPEDACCGPTRLLLLAGPANYTRWGHSKQRLKTMIEHPSAQDTCQHRIITRALMEELLFTGLVLSKAHKLVEVWSHRLWVWCQLVPLLSRLCSPQRCVHWLRLIEQTVVEDAFYRHPMNLNAWHYLRQVVCVASSGSLFQATLASTWVSSLRPIAFCDLCELIEYHVERATHYLRTHHSDASCSRFLIDVLNSAACGTTLINQQDASMWLVLLERIWRALMILSARLLSQTAMCGHESLWQLRLGLISFALQARRRFSADLHANWTVVDELYFVHSHASTTLVVVDVVHDLVACSGSVMFHQWHASRYGLQLLSLVSGGPPDV
jgi:hypothetical protein